MILFLSLLKHLNIIFDKEIKYLGIDIGGAPSKNNWIKFSQRKSYCRIHVM